jgi:lysophospholipase L1-like esterase
MLSFLIGLLVSLLLAEAALRILVRSSIYHPSLDLRPDIRMEIRNSVPGLSPICRHTTNSRGLRGDEPPADWEEHLTILTVGGSTTQCFNMDDRTTWSSLLQESLRVYTEHTWVGNGGLNGHTSRGHILFMTEVVPELNPDMVIILCGINDLTPSLNRSSRRRMTISSNVHAKGPGLGEFLYESSRLVQLLVRWKLILFDNADIVTSVSSHESFCETPPGFSEGPLPSDLRLILPSLPEYESNIRTIIGLGREAGVNLVFLTQPMLIEENDHWRRLAYSEATGMDYSCATVWRMMDVFNKELMQICLEENIPCFDLAGALGHDREFLFDQMHFTEAGTQEVARLVSEFMVEENLVPSPDVQN